MNQNQVTSLLIKSNKKRLQNTIDHYHRNLPPTYMETRKVIKRKGEVLKDIRESEIKNTMFVDPMRDSVGIPISSQSGEVGGEEKLYLIPDFLNVSHRKKMNKLVHTAYTDYVNKNKKDRNIQKVHTDALEVSLDEINKYIFWVEKNNDRLVKNYPELFSYKKDVEENLNIPAPKEEKGFINKIKKMFVRGN